MNITKVPSVLGVAVDSIISAVNLVGNRFYVDGTNGLDSQSGTADLPLKTIQAALNKCVSAHGDIVYVKPGVYAETLAVTGKKDVTMIGLAELGLGNTNVHRPKIKPATGVSLTLNQTIRFKAQGFSLHGTGGASAGVLTDGEASVFDNCVIIGDGVAGIKFHSAVDPDYTGSGTSLFNCTFADGASGIQVIASTATDSTGQATNCVVQDCQFYNLSGADIKDDGADGNYFDEWLFTGNKHHDTKAVWLAMSGRGGATTNRALMANCYFANVTAPDNTKFALPTGLKMVGCYDTNGLIDSHAF